MNNTVEWSGYLFHVCDYEGLWKNVGGIYLFTGLSLWSWKYPLYIGKAKNFHERMSGHEKWALAVALGATHVHALVVDSEFQRMLIEHHLIQAYDPPLNKQLPANPFAWATPY